MSIDLEMWSVERPDLMDFSQGKSKWELADGWAVHAERGWQLVVETPEEVDSDEVPEEVSAESPGVRFLTQLRLEPIGAPDSAYKALQRVAKDLAKRSRGVIYDPQEDSVTLPSGVKKIGTCDERDTVSTEVMSPAETQTVIFEVRSVAPLLRAGMGVTLGGVLDEHSSFRPTRFGPRDPARTKVTDPPAQLEALLAKSTGPSSLDVYFDGPNERSGSMGLLPDPFAWEAKEGAHHSTIEWWVGAPTGDALGQTEAFFRRWCEVTDAYYGFITTSSMARQLAGFRGNHRNSRPWQSSPLEISTKKKYSVYELFVADVYWVQYLGPGFVARFGREMLGELGVRREETSNGGVIVWATEAPVDADPGAQRPEDYPWKQPFYDALGRGVFFRSDYEWADFGEHVPLLREHATHLGTSLAS